MYYLELARLIRERDYVPSSSSSLTPHTLLTILFPHPQYPHPDFYLERARLIRERDYAFEVKKVKHQMDLAAGKSVADLLLSSLMDQQQHPQAVVGLVPGERVSEGVRAVVVQGLQERLQRRIDEQV